MPQDVSDSQPQNGAARHKAFPLALAQEGEWVSIVAYRAGKGLEHKLRAMGLPVGAQARVIQHKGSGVVLGVNATRIALGAAVAQQVYVELAAGAAGCRPGGQRCKTQRAALRADTEAAS